MFEQRKEPVIGHAAYFVRLLRHAGFAIGMLLASLLIGVLGFKFISRLDWLPSFVDACMLLGGMGPVTCGDSGTDAGRIFASLYALFCGIVFVAAMGVILAPVIHRFLHKFHFSGDE